MTFPRSQLRADYSCSAIIKGCWHLAGGHGAVDAAQAVHDMVPFVEQGITSFDCADHYTGVEELIGQFRRAHPGLAKQMQVNTKCVPDYDRMQSADRAYITAIIDRSLQRLNMERLDLVQFHWWNYAVPGYLDALGILAELRQQGKIAHLGLTNFNTAITRKILEAGIPIMSTQVQYSLLDDRPSKGLVQLCQDHQVHLMCYGSLAGGLLSDAWLNVPEPLSPFENRSHTKYKLIVDDFGGWALFQSLLQCLRSIADRRSVSIAQVASRWVIEQAQVAAAIVGFTSTARLPENLALAALKLDAQDHQAIAAILAQRRGPSGDCYDIERDKTGRHGSIMRYNLNEGRH
jgi:aryl-alcohol dehydrogenase-like predicted oxidoreductase